MFEFSQGLSFNLPDPFPSDLELLSHFFESVFIAVAQSKPHFQNLRFPFCQGFKGLLDLFSEVDVDDGIGGGRALSYLR